MNKISLPWVFFGTFLLLSTTVTSRKNPEERTTKNPRGSHNAGKCRLLINEVNIFPAGSMQFLELKRACSIKPERIADTSVSNYKLVFITHDAFLIGTCSLGQGGNGHATKREGDILFYVIGASGVQDADMQIKSCEFATDYVGYNGDHFPIGDSAPIAIALLHNKEKKILSGVSLDKSSVDLSNKKVYIRYSMEQVIMKNIQDMYVITSSSPFTSCKYFENFYAGYTINTMSVIRDWGQFADDVQKSLSRCRVESLDDAARDWAPFQPESFNLAKSSPGKHNLCITSVHFVVEDLQPKRKRAKVDFESKYQCEISTEDEAIESLNMIMSPMLYQAKLRLAITEALWNQLHPVEPMETDVVLDTHPQPSQVGNFFRRENENEPSSNCVPNPVPVPKEQFERYLQESSPFIWNDCSRFEPKGLLEAIRADVKNSPLRETDIMSAQTCHWFEWLGDLKRFRCKLCNRLWSQSVIFDSKRHITKMITVGQGYMKGSSAKFDNKKLIEKHGTSTLHGLAVEYHRLYDEGFRGDVLRRKFTEPDGMYRKFLRKTENRFISVFQSIRMDIPFLKYPLVSELLDYFGVDLGKQFNTADGNKEILMSISSKIHADHVEYLRVRKPEMSLLIDTSSDIQSLYSMTILFQTYNQAENIVAVTYRVILVDQRETSENLYNLLVNSLKEDGLFDWVKEKCIGFSTDGGANVKKLTEMLNRVTDHELIYNYCHSHRLERAVTAAWGKDDLLKEVEAVVNEVKRTFNCHSPRKRLLMMQKIRENADSTFELKSIKKIRWVNSKRRATRTVIRHWKTILGAIQAVQVDKTFPTKQREAAQKLESKFKDPAIIFGLAFLADATEELSKVSLNLQAHGTTLVGKKVERENMKKGLIALKAKPGAELSRVLGLTVVPGGTTALTGVDGLNVPGATVAGVKLSKSRYFTSSTIQTVLNGYVDAMIQQIDSYFPPAPSDYLDVFDQRAWPTTSMKDYGNDDIRKANSGFKWNFLESKLLQEWETLKVAISTQEDYDEWKTASPEDFWCHYLQKDVGWSDSLKTIMKNILTVPAGTAHVERVYSHYTAIKTIRRYSLKVESIEAIIRVKLNGPDTVKEFAERAHEYVKFFILAGHSRSDDVPKDVQAENEAECTSSGRLSGSARPQERREVDESSDDSSKEEIDSYEADSSEERSESEDYSDGVTDVYTTN